MSAEWQQSESSDQDETSIAAPDPTAVRGAVPAAAESVIIPPPPPPVAPPEATGGNVTALRSGGRPAPTPVSTPTPVAPTKQRSWLVPVLAGVAVLALLCGVGAYLGLRTLLGGNPDPGAAGRTSGGPNLTSTANATFAPVPTTAAATTPAGNASGGNASGGNASGGQTQQPTGPQIVYFKVTHKPQCPSGTNLNYNPGEPFAVIEWKVTGADSTELSVDGPGFYGAYGLQGSESLGFSCGDQGSTEKHTYTLKTIGGGSQRTKTITVSAFVNVIATV